MSARAESEYIPTQEDVITKSMYKITETVIKQTLQQSDARQPVITEHCGADMEWLKMQPASCRRMLCSTDWTARDPLRGKVYSLHPKCALQTAVTPPEVL